MTFSTFVRENWGFLVIGVAGLFAWIVIAIVIAQPIGKGKR